MYLVQNCEGLCVGTPRQAAVCRGLAHPAVSKPKVITNTGGKAVVLLLPCSSHELMDHAATFCCEHYAHMRPRKAR